MAKDEPAAPAADENKGEEQAQPEQKQVRGVSLKADDLKGWGEGTQIVEKEAKTEENVLRNEFEENVNKGEQPAEKTEEKPAETDDKPIELEAAKEPEYVEIEDPGEFVPNDYSFDVTIYNEEGKQPQTRHITSIQQWEQLLETEPNLGSSLAVNKAFRSSQKMELGLERDQANFDKKKAKYDEALQNEKQQQERNATILNEMNYLMEKGELPKLTREEMTNLDWTDKAVQKLHPNVKPHIELLNYMNAENKVRTKAGLQPFSSAIDAYNAMQLDQTRQKQLEQKKKLGEARKQAGSKVSGTSGSPMSSGAPRGISVGRVGDLSRLGQNWNV